MYKYNVCVMYRYIMYILCVYIIYGMYWVCLSVAYVVCGFCVVYVMHVFYEVFMSCVYYTSVVHVLCGLNAVSCV